MKTKEEKLKELKEALEQKLISVNEYCSMYHQISNQ